VHALFALNRDTDVQLPVTVRILLSLKDHPTTDLYTLFERLQNAGIYPTGGADLGDLQQAILFRRPEDSDQAIALLKKMGFDVELG
jgi:hypothetical protein